MSLRKRGLDVRDFISAAGVMGTIAQSFLKSSEDLTGNTYVIDGLVREIAKGGRPFDVFIRQRARAIWDLVETPVSLVRPGCCALHKLLARYPSVKLTPKAVDENEAWIWSDSIPSKPCKYRLFHAGRPTSIDDLLNAKLSHAGIRELIVYLASLTPEEGLDGFRIFGMGSRRYYGVAPYREEDWDKANKFPVATWKDGHFLVSEYSVDQEDTVAFGTDCFFLVREWPNPPKK